MRCCVWDGWCCPAWLALRVGVLSCPSLTPYPPCCVRSGKLFDLLNARKQLRALADHKEAVKIMGLSDRKVSAVTELLKVIDQGNAARSTGSTGANMDSSRSHAVLQISLHHHKTRKMRGKFSFVDLAGSERGADTTHNDRQTRCVRWVGGCLVCRGGC